MSKTIPDALQAHYESGSTTLARLWKITRRDGEVYGFTDHDQALTFSSVPYEPTSAFDASTLTTRAELNVDGMELLGLLDSAGITADEIEAGLWDGARIELRQVNWADPTDGAEVLRVGEIGNIQRRGGAYVAELRGLMQALQNNVGRVITPTCDATLGDTRCGVNLAALSVSATVTAVTDRREFTASGLAQAAGYFAGGQVDFTGGANDGKAMDVREFEAGVVTLNLPLPYDVEVGDTFDIVPGCDKTKPTCKTKFSNVVNFRGFSFVPGLVAASQIGGQ